MLKNYFLAIVCAVGFACATQVHPVSAADGDIVAASDVDADQAELDALQAQVEQLIVDNANDPAALKAAIEALVAGHDKPELAAKAVVAALTRPKSAAAVAALSANARLKVAAGEGLGAAIATIALTNPDMAAAMQASVAASGDTSLASAVSSGTESKTASLRERQGQKQQEAKDTTPETPISAE
jgi:hypothetical protein